jgi:hypothetical protein
MGKAARKKFFSRDNMPRMLLVAAFLATIVAGNYFFLFDFHTSSIADKCGEIANTVMHTVQDKENCDVRCKAQCESQSMLYVGSKFKEQQTTCNACTCTCKSIGGKA